MIKSKINLDANQLFEEYVIDLKKMEQMAEEHNVSKSTIQRNLTSFNITGRYSLLRKCPCCYKEFRNIFRHMKYCKKNPNNIKKRKRGRKVQIISVNKLKDFIRKNKIKRFGYCNNKRELLELIINDLEKRNKSFEKELNRFQKIYEELYKNE